VSTGLKIPVLPNFVGQAVEILLWLLRLMIIWVAPESHSLRDLHILRRRVSTFQAYSEAGNDAALQSTDARINLEAPSMSSGVYTVPLT
jgi:hypothetical protein